jgi:asparagine synthase (glutamine-hydrolysing)
VCGVNGILRLRPDAPPISREELRRIRDHMQVRGPDGFGEWFSSGNEIALGHRRLAIIDLSDAGAQPMASADGRYHIVFNGEIYNYRDLRAELASTYPFRSQSDTEAILALFARDGVDAFGRLRGMFALAIWDDREKRLLLARDPNGIKPLYYANDGQQFRFASQVKALVGGGAVPTKQDPAALCGFLLWGSVPEPWTIYESVKAVPAGHYMWMSAEDRGKAQPLPSVRHESVPFTDAIEGSLVAHLVADVPVAVFLSAGLDSSLVAALATRHLPEPPATMTLRFREFEGTEADEGPLAAETARALGTRHFERWVTRQEFLQSMPAALAAMDQPSIDGFNTYWISRAAHEAGIKVALSGLGGDELLGGYPSFRQVPRLARWARPASAWPGVARAWETVAGFSDRSPKLPGLVRYGCTLGGAYFLRRALYLPEELTDLVGPEVAGAGLRACDPEREAARVLAHVADDSGWQAVHALETALYLRNQLLRDSDWASMSASLELRVPFVDAALQAALRTPIGEAPPALGKVEVARRLAPELPLALFSRRKTGFLTPFAEWLEGAPRATLGRGSRGLALRVLAEWGIETAPTARRRSIGRGAEHAAQCNLLLLPGLHSQKGGIQTYGQNLVEALRQIGGEPHALVLNDAPGDLAPLALTGVRARGFARRRVAFALAAARAARSGSYADVWLGHRNFLPLAPVLRRPGRRVTLLVYGIDAWPGLSWTERRALRSVDRVLAISPYTADCFRRAGFEGPVELLPCSLPFGWAVPERRPAAFESPYRLLTVSRLSATDRYKGVDLAIQAVALLLREGTSIRYDIVGSGADTSRLRSEVDRAGLTDCVTFHGSVDDATLRSLYSACDVFVLPSTGEGFGIVFLEAMACERTVIAADAGAVRSLVEHGVTGFLVSPSDLPALTSQIRQCLLDPTSSRAVAIRGCRHVERQYAFDSLRSQLADFSRAALAARPVVPVEQSVQA